MALGDIALPQSLKGRRSGDARGDLPQGDAVGRRIGISRCGASRPISRAGWPTNRFKACPEPLARRLTTWERKHRTFLGISGIALFTVALVAVLAALFVNAARERAEARAAPG